MTRLAALLVACVFCLATPALGQDTRPDDTARKPGMEADRPAAKPPPPAYRDKDKGEDATGNRIMDRHDMTGKRHNPKRTGKPEPPTINR